MVSRSKRRIQVSLIEQLKHIVLLLGAVRTSKQVAAGGRGAQHVFSPLLAHFALHGLKTVYRCASLLLQTCTAIIICWWCCMRSSGCHKVSIVNILHAGSSINVPFCRPASDLCTGRGAECWKKKKEVKYRGRRPSKRWMFYSPSKETTSRSLSLSLSRLDAGRWKINRIITILPELGSTSSCCCRPNIRYNNNTTKDFRKRKSPVIYV